MLTKGNVKPHLSWKKDIGKSQRQETRKGTHSESLPTSGRLLECMLIFPVSHLGYQCNVGFYFWIRNIKIRIAVRFIPDEVLTTQFKEPIMNHSVVMSAN